jgi:hypothetical protein
MRHQQVITDVCLHASEWIEMVENPTALVVGIMAHKIVELEDYIQYLENRMKSENYN